MASAKNFEHNMRGEWIITGGKTKIRGKLAILLLVTVLSIGVQVLADTQPIHSRIPIGPTTTRITHPLGRDGFINYAAALDEIDSKDVTPQNNAAIPLLTLCWPDLWLGKWEKKEGKQVFVHDQPMERKLIKGLGLPQAVQRGINASTNSDMMPGPRYVSCSQYIIHADTNTHPELRKIAANWNKPKYFNQYQMQETTARSSPWSPEKYPWMLDWIQANKIALNYADHACLLPNFYVPILLKHKKLGLLTNLLPFLGPLIELSYGLEVRAMLELHQKQLASCERDLLAVHRLGRLVAKSPFAISFLVGQSIDQTADRGDWALANADWITQNQYRAYAAELDQLPPMPSISAIFDIGERFLTLDILQRLSTPRMRRFLMNPGFGLAIMASWTTQDSVAAMELANQISDLNTIAIRKSNVIKRLEAMRAVRLWINRMKHSNSAPEKILSQLEEHNSHFLIMNVASCAVTRIDRLALALAEYRAKYKTYPAKLSALVPNYMAILPLDPFTDRSFNYSVAPDHCAIWSSGQFSRLNEPDGIPNFKHKIKLILRLHK